MSAGVGYNHSSPSTNKQLAVCYNTIQYPLTDAGQFHNKQINKNKGIKCQTIGKFPKEILLSNQIAKQIWILGSSYRFPNSLGGNRK